MYLFFFALISSVPFFIANGQANPLLKWKLENPTTTFTSETNKFALTYDIDTSINEGNIRGKVFSADCQNPVDGTKAIEVSDGIIVENTSALNGKGSFEFALDLSKLAKNDDVFDSSNPEKPMIKLCARFMLWTPDGGHEVNFIESLLTLRFNLQDTEFSYSGFDSKYFDSSGETMS